MDTMIDAREMTKDAYGYTGRNIPSTWDKMELSLGCGKKITMFYVDDTVMLMRAYGANPWDSVDSWLKDGRYTSPIRGSSKVVRTMKAMGELLAGNGMRGAIRQYSQDYVVCCCCGAHLTDHESKMRGIGPVCIQKAHGAALLNFLLS